MENETYSAEDIFPFNKSRYFKVKSYYAGNSNGMVHSVTIDPGIILTSSLRTLSLMMNPNISYMIIMTDPKLQFISSNPKAVPRTVLKLPQNSGTIQLYLQVINILQNISPAKADTYFEHIKLTDDVRRDLYLLYISILLLCNL